MRITSAFLIAVIAFVGPAWPCDAAPVSAHPDSVSLDGAAGAGSMRGEDPAHDLYAARDDRGGPTATRAEPVCAGAPSVDPRPLASTPERNGIAPSRPGEPERVRNRGP